MMDIVVITDKWFVMPTGVMMYSVCVNNPDTDIVFHVIVDEGVPQKYKEHIVQSVTKEGGGKTVKFYSIDSKVCQSLPKGNGRSNITYATYYRLFLTEVLPPTIDKVLYMDGDIIVRHSLQNLWDTDVSDYGLAAVTDYHVESLESTFDRLEYPREFGYFNAGVLLINLKYWRSNSILTEFMQYLSTHSEKIVFHDQDVLNATFKNKKLSLPAKYNLQGAFLYESYDWLKEIEEVREAINDPVVVHFTGQKPWETPADGHPFSSTFFKYQYQTLWKGQKAPDRRTWYIRFRGYIGAMLRFIGILPPSKRNYRYVYLPPIDPLDA